MLDKIFKLFQVPQEIKKRNAQRRVLICDDSEVDRKVIESVLTRYGYQVLVSTNGISAIEKAQTQKPDLILMDCQMPGMKGPDVCRELKKNMMTQRIPVVFLTSLDTPKNVIDCFDADAENYLSKPVNAKILADQIDTILSPKKSSV